MSAKGVQHARSSICIVRFRSVVMSVGLSPVVAYAAGALTILSPCVLPLVPIVLGSAAQRHRWGPLALALGLVASVTVTGLVIATLGASIGLNTETIRWWSAVLLLI